MKVLVTGGAGFIGSNLVDSLLSEGHSVLVVDNFDPFYDRRIKQKNIEKHLIFDDYTLIETDIRDRESMNKIFSQYEPEVVVHLAAKAGVRPSVENPLQYVEVNINGTANLLEISVKNNVKKFIFASSSSVYGLNEKVPFSENDPILDQASPYGATKAAGEALCRSFSNCYDISIVALRFFTVYGPGQRPDLAIHKFAKKILNNEPIMLFGDGSTCRDYTYIDDIVYGIRSSIDYCAKGYQVFNIGNDRPTQLIDLVRNLEMVLKKEAKINWLPEQIGDVPRTWANIEKARGLLDYNPKVDIVTGLGKFSEWIREDNILKV